MTRMVWVGFVFLYGCGLWSKAENLPEANTSPWKFDLDFKENAAPSEKEIGAEEIFSKYGSVQLVPSGESIHGLLGVKRSGDVMHLSAVYLGENTKGEKFLLSAGHLDNKFFQIQNVFAYFSHTTDPPVEAELLIIDRVLDWALLKIKDKNFKVPKRAPPIGNSDNLVLGQKVFAIGSPLGYSHCIREGIVVNLSTAQNYFFTQPKLIMHQCPINPGDSGGGLYNAKGELIGLNVMGREAPNWVLFAVPIEDILKVLKRTEKAGYVEHPFLGCKAWNTW
ncbi:MAG: trypsin-like peptidase domain-containing protein, partial [Patescibacteria group bacterium]